MAENGSSETTASDSGRAPFTRSSKRDRIRVSRTNRPSAEGVTTSPSRPLMVKVDSSTRVTTPPAWPEARHLAAEGPRVAHPGRRYRTGSGPPNDLVGAFLGATGAARQRGARRARGIATMAVVKISPRR